MFMRNLHRSQVIVKLLWECGWCCPDHILPLLQRSSLTRTVSPDWQRETSRLVSAGPTLLNQRLSAIFYQSQLSKTQTRKYRQGHGSLQTWFVWYLSGGKFWILGHNSKKISPYIIIILLSSLKTTITDYAAQIFPGRLLSGVLHVHCRHIIDSCSMAVSLFKTVNSKYELHYLVCWWTSSIHLFFY